MTTSFIFAPLACKGRTPWRTRCVLCGRALRGGAPAWVHHVQRDGRVVFQAAWCLPRCPHLRLLPGGAR
jgi:hypothetical protein